MKTEKTLYICSIYNNLNSCTDIVSDAIEQFPVKLTGYKI